MNPIPTQSPGFVHILHIPYFRLSLSNQSVGGNMSGVKRVKSVKLTVGAESVSITDLNVSIIRISNQCLQRAGDSAILSDAPEMYGQEYHHNKGYCNTVKHVKTKECGFTHESATQ